MKTYLLPKVIEKFWERVETSKYCWNWRGPFVKGGYGVLSVWRIGTFRVHRLSWKIHNGLIPGGLFVCHKCDNPKCVRPSHLFLGTAKDNAVDASKKGRTLYGMRSPCAKLTNEDVIEARKSFARGDRNWRAGFAKKHGLNPDSLKNILNQSTWKHLPSVEEYRREWR